MSQPFKALAPASIRTIEVDYFPPLVNPFWSNGGGGGGHSTVDAGPSQALAGILSATLNGSASAINGAPITTEWTLVSGPGTASFVDDTSVVTGITVSEYGVYVFRLTATLGYWTASDDTVVSFLPIPLVDLVCSSESGSATLCGFDEYTTPSTPPKKYRTQTAAGTIRICYFASPICSGNTFPFAGSQSFNAYRGTYTYGASDCAEVNAQFRDSSDCEFTPQGCGLACGALTDVQATNALPKNWTGAFYCGGSSTVTTPTQVSYIADGLCGTCGSGIKQQGTATKTLSDEDTEVDAIGRASLTPGSSCTAAIESRGAADFTFNFVAVAFDLDCSDLFPGANYHATVDLLQENYGGGSPSTTTQHFYFTATGLTHQIQDVISCPSGKQVTVQNATIALA